MELLSYIELFYNQRRRHSTLGHSTMNIDTLRRRADEFNRAELSVSHRSGPPYVIKSDEIDVQHTLRTAQGGQRARVNRSVLSIDALRSVDVMLCPAPADDFDRYTVSKGRIYEELMGDVMGSMTGKANPSDLRLLSRSPNYAMEFLRAALPAGRVTVLAPQTFQEYVEALERERPQVVMLSGLNVNVRTLLKMGLAAREHGVDEVWLGGDTALAPYRIINEMFDRVVWGPGERFLHTALVGGDFTGLRHPEVPDMLASVDWLRVDADGALARSSFQTLHLALRLGCTQSCDYCAEGLKSNRGRDVMQTSAERACELIDRAYDVGIRRVYFIDPDFGRVWHEQIEGKVIRHLADKRMRWSCLTSVVAIRRHGTFMADHGLASVYLGIESLAPSHRDAAGRRVLTVLDRRWQNQDETEALIDMLSARGVLVFGLYILYNPGETDADVWKGVEALKKLVPLSQISTNQPFPGTEEFAVAVKKRLLFNLDPDAVRYGQMVWAPDGASGPVHDPAAVTETYIDAHLAVNDLRRPGGFLDRLRSRRSA